jgi:roadblock/LC7 domain-containing protein
VSPPGGHYETPEILIKHINRTLSSAETAAAVNLPNSGGGGELPKRILITGSDDKAATDHIGKEFSAAKAQPPTTRFSYNEISKRISIDFKCKNSDLSGISIKMKKDLAALMGFEWQSIAEYDAKVKTILDNKKLDDEQREKSILNAGKYTEDDDMVDLKSSKSSYEAERVKKFFAHQIEKAMMNIRKFTEFDNDMVELKPGKFSYTAERVCDLQRGFYSLFIYCDVVEPVVVGDAKVPLLRTVNIGGKEGLTINRIYQNVQYVPLHRKQFDTVEIDIRDDTGRRVPFERGKVVVTLHFRQRKPAYF